MQSVYTVQELFTDKVLRIPDYQRGYAWERQQLEDFWEDLEYLGPDKDHYTGTVIRELNGFSDWDESSILKRRKKITEWYLKRWHLDEVSGDASADEPELDEIDEEVAEEELP